MVTMLLGLFTWLWHLTPYILYMYILYMPCVPTMVVFSEQGERGIRIAVLLYGGRPVYDMWGNEDHLGCLFSTQCSVFYPSFGAYLWGSTKLYLVCGGTGAGNFPQLFIP